MISGYAYNAYTWPSVISSLFFILLAVYSWQRRAMPGAIPLAAGCLFAAAIVSASVMEYSAINLPHKLFWSRFQSCIQAPVLFATTSFILEYTWPGRWLNRRVVFLQAIFPIAYLVLALTNDLHHLAWVGFIWTGSSPIRQIQGVVSIFAIFSLIPILEIINLIAFTWLIRISPQHRWPVFLIFTGQLTGRLLYILVRMGVFRSVFPIDLIGMGFEFLMYAAALFGFHLLDPISLAKHTVIEQMQTGMLVLDNQELIVNLNPAAEAILEISEKAARGKSFPEIIPISSEVQVTSLAATGFSRKKGQEKRDFTLTHSSLKDFRGYPVGSLVMLNDVTDQNRIQAQIIEQQRALAILQEREHLARELHDGIGQVMGYIKMQGQAARDQLSLGQIAELDRQLAQLVSAAQDAHTDIREYILGAKIAVPSKGGDRAGFLVGLNEYLQRFSDLYKLQIEFVEPPDWCDDLLEPTVEVQLLRIIQEALTNVRKHARATFIRVIIQLDCSQAHVTIQDDGVGFDPDQIARGEGQTFGLGFLHERASEIGGKVSIISSPGKGTSVIADVPRRL